MDDTLLDFHRAEEVALQHTFDHFGIDFNQITLETYKAINQMFWKEFEHGNVSISQVQEGRFSVFFNEIGVLADGVDGNNEYQHQLSNHVYVIENAFDTLNYLSQKYDLFIVTNGVATTQRKRIIKANFSRYFRHLFISEEIGASKPSPSFFAAVIDYVRDDKLDKYLIIGDSLSSDIIGGINYGIDTCWYNPKSIIANQSISPTFNIGNLSNLCSLL